MATKRAESTSKSRTNTASRKLTKRELTKLASGLRPQDWHCGNSHTDGHMCSTNPSEI